MRCTWEEIKSNGRYVFRTDCGHESWDYSDHWQFCPYCGESLEYDFIGNPGGFDVDRDQGEDR